ncbi:MAG: 50S ribosomal protein L25 [Phycisphaerae bacterium]|nr:50S ribosomal protein L25 [Phycisphaerae bacterium]
MEKTLVLKANIREHTGSHSNRTLRKKGLIPAIVYGHKQDAVSVSLNSHDFVEGLHHGHRLMEMEVEGKKQTVLIKDIQYDYLGKEVIHADLMRVDVTETVTIEVQIELKGTAVGTQHGGIIETHADRLEIECRVTDIPESIAINIKAMDVGSAIHAKDIALPANVKLISEPDLLVLTCHEVAAAKSTEELETEAPIAPEIIGAKKEEEQEES